MAGSPRASGNTVVILASSTEGAERLLLVLAVVILVGPFIVQKLRLPGIVGLVLGGAIVGPQGLEWLEEGQIDGLGDIGLLYLMFMAGLELDLIMLQRYRGAAIRFGLLTFACPFLIGWIGAAAFGQPRASAILLGSIWASHTLVSLPEAKRAGLAANRAVAIAVSATALTDTLALVVLAVVTSGAADEPGGRPMVELSLGLVVLAVYCLWFLPTIGRFVFRVVAHDRTARFVFLLASFSSAALISGSFGIEGLVGAFLAGLGANRLVPAGGALMERTEFTGTAIFVPAFLVFVGTQLDLAALGSVETLTVAAGFVAIVVVGKAVAALVSARLERLSLLEAGLMTGLTVGQAAATLAATLVGESVGLFDTLIVNAVLVAVLVVILVSSIITAVFARLSTPEVPSDRPLGSTVVIGIRPGRVDDGLVALATRLAAAHGGRLVPVRVLTNEGSDDDRAAAGAELERAVGVATRHGADTEGILRVDSSMVDGLLNACREFDATALVVPWDTTTTRTERVFGRAVEEIGQRSPIPVLAGDLSGPEPQRVVLALADVPRAGGARLDTELAAEIVAALSDAGTPASVLTSDPASVDGLHLGEVVVVDDVARDDLVATVEALDDDALVVVPAGLLRRGSHLARARSGRNVLTVAGPFRLQVTSGGTGVALGRMIGFDRTTAT